MKKIENLILGAGIAGLAAGEKLENLKKEYLIIEKDASYGGLCDNFVIEGFRFDKCVHFSFTEDSMVRSFFDKQPYLTHIPNPRNYYHGTWIKHPAQNNLYPLSKEEKDSVLKGMLERKNSECKNILNYEEWLRLQFGDYFAEKFSMVYTKKYWGVPANQLETKWVGKRVYQPSIDEVIEGMNTMDTPVTYYAKEMRYPENGGFKQFLKGLKSVNKVMYNEEVLKIDTVNKIVHTNKSEYKYQNLYSSIPLPEYENILELDDSTIEDISLLNWTSVYIVSLGLGSVVNEFDLWDYIYDEDILPARIYSPSMKSQNNCPKGCSSIQAEIYFKHGEKYPLNESELLNKVIDDFAKIGLIDKRDVKVKDIRFIKYGNVIFDHNIYTVRNRIKTKLKDKGINVIGRFGEWDYLWSDQSFLSGYDSIDKIKGGKYEDRK